MSNVTPFNLFQKLMADHLGVDVVRNLKPRIVSFGPKPAVHHEGPAYPLKPKNGKPYKTTSRHYLRWVAKCLEAKIKNGAMARDPDPAQTEVVIAGCQGYKGTKTLHYKRLLLSKHIEEVIALRGSVLVHIPPVLKAMPDQIAAILNKEVTKHLDVFGSVDIYTGIDSITMEELLALKHVSVYPSRAGCLVYAPEEPAPVLPIVFI